MEPVGLLGRDAVLADRIARVRNRFAAAVTSIGGPVKAICPTAG